MTVKIDLETITEWDDIDGDIVHARGRDCTDGQRRWAWVSIERIAEERPDLAARMIYGPGEAP